MGGWEDGGGGEACPMSVANNKIITVQKMGDATVEARAWGGTRGRRGRATTVAANIQIPSPSLSFSVPLPLPSRSSIDFGRRPPSPRAVSFYFIGVQ